MIGFDSFEYASLTDVGIRRSHNQDAHASLLASDAEQWREQGHIFLVADGMGAHAVGELASELAVSLIPHTYHKYAPQGGVPALRKAFVEANASIHAKGQQNPEFGGMGTTTTALLLRPEGAWVGHVGDSRAYRIRGDQIEQMSFDHSLVWEMARRQGVEPEGLHGIPSNVIVRSLGPEPLVEVDVEGPHAIKPDDIFLICSDGLSGQVNDQEIGAIAGCLPPAEACRVLVDLANLRGGPDNITVVIVRVRQQSPARMEHSGERRPWYLRIPWPVWCLLIGVLLAGEAAYCVYFFRHPEDGGRHPSLQLFGWGSFVFSALAIGSGLVGLGLNIAREKRRMAAEPEHPPPKIYRQASSLIERALVEKLRATVATSSQQIKDKQWELDWKTYESNWTSAEILLGRGELAASLREFSRGMHLLAEALRRQRPRGQGFEPLWG
ncbi:MAG TPA: protein phosphatase 2C domain-containing protein [Gemmataceae bacterium]|nr:protein phosphatase 2C domain-containing protein [Gemmataceae bacterium]